MEVTKKDFDEFISWLKIDGLYPKKSERLWRKKIFSNLVNNDSRTIENFDDFCHATRITKLLNMHIRYKHIDSTIVKVELLDSQCYITTLDNHRLIVNSAEMDSFLKLFNHE